MEGDAERAKEGAESAASMDQLLVRTAEEEEIEAQGLNSSCEAYDDDFLIMEEVNEDDDYEAPAPEHHEDPKESAKQGPSATQGAPPEDPNPDPPSAIKVILLDDDAEEDEKGAEETGDAPVVGEPEEAAIVGKEPTTDSAAERAVVTEEDVDGGTEAAATGDAEGTSAGDAEEVFAVSDSKEVVEAGEEEEAAEADSELTAKENKVAAEEGEAAVEEDEAASEEDEEAAEEDKQVVAEEDKEAAVEEVKEAAVEEDKEAALCESMEEDAPMIDLCSEADERDVDDMDEGAVKVELKGEDPENPPEESEAGKENESPILNGGDVVGLPAMGLKEDLDMEQVLATEPKKRRRLASSGYSSLAELKKALGVTDGSDAAPDGSKRIKFEDGAESDKGVLTECKPEEGVSQTPPPVGIPVGPNLVVLSRAQLEAYVAQRVRECLSLQGQALLQPMEKKCETLHRALERWRRRSFQLQKQLNEFVCEQERCAGARRNRVMQRSVGVCVRMPPLKQQPTLTPIMATSRPAISTANSTVAAGVSRPSQPAPGMVQQVRMTGASASNLAAQLGFKPNQAMKLVTVSTPSGGTTTVVTRMPPQVASPSTPTSMPVPVQLIANTGTPSQQVKSVSLPSGTAGSGTVVRTVAVVSSASSTPSTVSQTVKFIDLTQEEEGHAKVISMPAMSMAGNTVQKISMPSSAIPVLSAAPTSLVQVTPSASQPVLRAATAVSSGVVTQAGGSFRLTPSMMAQPRVTYLVPSLPPGMVVTPKESGPRIISGAPGSGTPMPMQTILLRMASPQGGFTTVPGNAITMGSLTPMPGGPGGPGTTMMVQAPAGSQVRMIRAPPPLSLPRGGTTLTLPPGTTLVRGPPNQGGGVTLVGGTPVGGVSGGPASSSTTTVRVPVPVPVSKPAGVAEATRGSPVVPVGAAIAVPAGTSVLGKVDTPASATAPPPVAKHPAPLPPTARYLDDPKKKRLPPKPALKITKAASAKQNKEVHMDQVLEQWQAFLNTGDGDKKSNGAGSSVKRRNATTAAAAPAEEDGGGGGTPKPARRLRLPYHTLRPLRLACLCRLGTCRYDKLSAAFKERLHAEFGRLRPERQLRLLVARMYSEGLVRSKVPRKGRCKWMYWMPACEVGRSKERVCKAGFMAVHGISEKRVRDVQLLWMRLRRTRGSTPTGEESELENESYLAELVEVDDKELKSTLKSKPLVARRPHPRRKILRETSSEDSSRDAEDEYDGDNSGPDAATIQRVYQQGEEARRKVYQRAAGAKGRAATSAAVKREADETQSGEETEAADGYREQVAAGGDADDDDDDEEEAPFMDISAFEPICSLEEDSENLVLSLPRGLVLSWNMTFNSLYAEIQTYQLYAYQETGGPPATSHWKKVGDVRALPLPMACTLTQFVEGHKYHFAVRAVDIHNRLGPFSEPSSILLK